MRRDVLDLPNWLIGVLSIGILLALMIVEAIAGVKHPFRKAILNMMLGVGALAAVNLASTFTGVSIPVSLLSLGVSASGGIPGVTMLVLLNMIV